jgi:hypothetical protein
MRTMTARTSTAREPRHGERTARACNSDRARGGGFELRCALRREGSALRIRWSKVARGLCALALVLPAAASAKIYSVWQPRLTVAAGYDDNVKFDGAGGDGLGEAIPGFKLGLFGDHQMHLALDCQANVARLLNPNRFSNVGNGFANSALCRADFRDRLDEDLRTHWSLSSTYARDAFAISSLGLLLRAGQTQVLQTRIFGTFSQAVSPRGTVEYGMRGDMLRFGENDPGNGYELAPQVAYAYRTSARNTVDLTAREQLFFAAGASAVPGEHGAVEGGLVAEGTSALLGFTRRLSPVTRATLRGGPLMLTQRGLAATFFPAARFELSTELPTSALRFVLAHDLVLGPSRAGALVGDIAEVGGFTEFWRRFGGHGRVGVYRNVGADRQGTVGLIGYSAELGLDWRFGREWSLGLAGLRDARLTQRNVFNVDRDVFQLRISWEKARD